MAIDSKVTDEQRRQMIAEAAYFRAEKRGFGVDPLADWIEAEVEIDARVREIENAQQVARRAARKGQGSARRRRADGAEAAPAR
jgi:hypothetical protein